MSSHKRVLQRLLSIRISYKILICAVAGCCTAKLVFAPQLAAQESDAMIKFPVVVHIHWDRFEKRC